MKTKAVECSNSIKIYEFFAYFLLVGNVLLLFLASFAQYVLLEGLMHLQAHFGPLHDQLGHLQWAGWVSREL